MTLRIPRIALAVTAFLLVAAPAHPWDDRTGDLDMPWLGGGGRADMFADRSTCIMCPTGYTDRRRWGASARSGEDPYGTVGAALRFLQHKGVLDAWPEALGEGTVIDDDGIITPRAAPYRFTVVMVQPTVVIMRFDLGALVKVGDVREGQAIGTPHLNQAVEFGTQVPATGTLLWFSPDAGRPPAPIPLSTPNHGEIVVKGTRLVLERRGGDWVVERP